MSAYQVEVLVELTVLVYLRLKVPVVVPFLTKTTCDHEFVFRLFSSIELLAIAEDVEEIVGVNVFGIFVIIVNGFGG